MRININNLKQKRDLVSTATPQAERECIISINKLTIKKI